MKNDISNINRMFYDQRAQWWSEHKTNSFWHERQFRILTTYFKRGDAIIDIGCANGIYVPLFLGIGRHLHYVGLDLSTKLLAIARRRYPHMRFIRADILDPFIAPRKKYAGFLASAVLMHIPEDEWPRLLSNLGRLIRPNGIGYISLPLWRPSPSSKNDTRFFSYWTLSKARSFLAKQRWKILRCGKISGGSSGWFWMIVQLPNSQL